MSRSQKVNGVWIMHTKPNYSRKREHKDPPQQPPPAHLECPHRSEAFELVGCPTCRGNVQVKVYQCEHFGATCSMSGKAAAKNCSTCEVPRG